MATDPPFSFLFLKIGIEFILFDSGKFNPSSDLCIISGCATLPKFLKSQGEDRKRMTTWWVPTETGLLGKAWERKNQGELWGGHIGLSQLLDLWLIFPLFKKTWRCVSAKVTSSNSSEANISIRHLVYPSPFPQMHPWACVFFQMFACVWAHVQDGREAPSRTGTFLCC